MPSSGIIDLAIGLVFVFGVTAALSSAITELIARLLGLRGAYLLIGLRELVDSNQVGTTLGAAHADYGAMTAMVKTGGAAPAHMPSVTGALLGGPILSSQGMTGQISSRTLSMPAAGKPGQLPVLTGDGSSLLALWRQRRSLPSYISAQSFAEAAIDMLVPDGSGRTTMSDIRSSLARLGTSIAAIGAPQPVVSPFQSSLQALARNVSTADNDISEFRTAVEHWYDDHMDRVSGWYKRRAAKITLAVGGILVIGLNVNALTIGRTLYTQDTVSAAVSAVAAKDNTCTAGQDPQPCLSTLQGELSAAATAGLPIGWGTVRDCTEQGARCNLLDQRGVFSRHGGSPWQLILVLLGFAIMILAIIPGARFWFGLLSKLGSLRTTGPKPAPAPAASS